MQYSHSSEKAGKFAKAAFDRMQEETLAPTPESYELWYVYYSGENPEVSHAIDILVESKEDITSERCAEMHQQFLSDANENDRVRQAGDRIQQTLKDVNGVVSNVKNSTTEYSAKLNDASSRLKAGMSSEELNSFVVDIKSNTDDVLSQNQELEVELAKSAQLMQELQRDLEQVKKEALTDGLTNISNRKAFDNEVRRLVADTEKTGQPFSLILMDIDHFKKFNDKFGHQVGDQVLRLVARTLLDGVKGKDMAARYGGEEFAILLPETNINGAMHVADKLREAVESKEVVNRNSGEKMARITLSGGVAQFAGGEVVDDLIERTDAALYTAKNNGRNQISMSAAPGQAGEAIKNSFAN